MQELEKLLFHMLAFEESKTKTRTSRHKAVLFQLKAVDGSREREVKFCTMQLHCHKKGLLPNCSIRVEEKKGLGIEVRNG